MLQKAITAVGNAQISTAQFKFGGSSALFDGAGDYLTIPDSNDFYFNGDFTIDAQVRLASTGTLYEICGQYADVNNYWTFNYNSGVSGLQFIHISGGVTQCNQYCSSVGLSTSVFKHIQVVKSGTTMYFFVDGVQFTTTVATAWGTPSDIAGPLTIGNVTGNYYNGYIDEFRISKGIARNTSNFTPPTDQYNTDSSTVLLLHFNNIFVDESVPRTFGEYLGAGSSVTAGLWHLNGSSADSSGNGNNGTDTAITYSPANGKFGQGAGFDGSTSKIALGDPTSLRISSLITVSAWINFQGFSQSTFATIVGKYNSGVDFGCWLLWCSWPSAGNLQWAVNANKTTDTRVGATFTPALDSLWHHVVGVADGTNIILYYDGKNVAQTAFSSAIDTVDPVAVGNLVAPFKGAIDEVIIESRAWSAAEIQKYYTFAKARFGII